MSTDRRHRVQRERIDHMRARIRPPLFVLMLMACPTLTVGDDHHTEHEAQWVGAFSFGVGVAAVFPGSLNQVKEEIGADGEVHVREFDGREVRPAFVASYLWRHPKKAVGVGPMVITDINLNESSGVKLNRLGVGVLFGFHSLNSDAQEEWHHDLGIGFAWSLDTDVTVQNDDGMVVDSTNESFLVVMTYSFGKR